MALLGLLDLTLNAHCLKKKLKKSKRKPSHSIQILKVEVWHLKDGTNQSIYDNLKECYFYLIFIT